MLQKQVEYLGHVCVAIFENCRLDVAATDVGVDVGRGDVADPVVL